MKIYSWIFRSFFYVFFFLVSVPYAYSDSVVTKWVTVELEALRSVPFLVPTISARELFIMHTCMYDAWAVYDPVAKGTRPDSPPKQPGGSIALKEKAISFAAYTCAVDLFPEQKSRFDNAMQAMHYNPNENSPAANIGRLVAQKIIDFRHHDGANQLGDLHAGNYSDYTNYQPVNTPDQFTDPNRWQMQRFSDGSVINFLTPHWFKVIPFALTAHDQFLPPPPNFYPHGNYNSQAEDILNKNRQLNDVHKMTYEFWAEETQGFLSVPGHWNFFSLYVSHRDHLDLDKDVKLFFALNNALHDAAIVAWDSKRFYDYVRPISAIRYLKKDQTVNAWKGPCQGTGIINGKDWRPYAPANFITPPFPEYISGHATMGSAAAQILTLYTGSDVFNYSTTIAAGSSYIEGSNICPSNPVPARNLTLTLLAFSIAANENARSRFFGGIHFQDAAEQGLKIGKLVADQAWVKTQTYINGTAT